MYIYRFKIEDILDVACFNSRAVKIKKGLKISLFLFLVALLAVTVFLISFNGCACAGQRKFSAPSTRVVNSVSEHSGDVDIDYNQDEASTNGRPAVKSRSFNSAKYRTSYKVGYASIYAHLVSAIVLFCTFVIISILGIIHYLNIKSSTKSECPSAPHLSSVYPINLSAVSALSSPPGVSGGGGGPRAMEAGGHDLYQLYERVKDVFKRVQQSWSERELSRAEKYMSRRFYYRQQRRMEDLAAAGERNIITNIEVIDVKIIEVKSGGDSGAGYMKAIIKFSMIDYTISESGGSLVRGDEYVPAESAEAWSFVSGDGGWVVDEVTAVI